MSFIRQLRNYNNLLVHDVINLPALIAGGGSESLLILVVLSFYCFRTLLETVKQEVKLNA